MAKNKRMGLKEKYALMTRGLDWETTYQPMDKVFPYDTYEGIKIIDWDKWEDPFRLTVDSYWKYQSEKERKLYAILDAFQQKVSTLSVPQRYAAANAVVSDDVPAQQLESTELGVLLYPGLLVADAVAFVCLPAGRDSHIRDCPIARAPTRHTV